MAPEQARGTAVDKRADLWAFGVVLYKMLTATRLFAGATVSDTLAAVLKTEPDWTTLPAGTPPPIRCLLRRCLEKDRKRRLDSAAGARLEIDDALTAWVAYQTDESGRFEVVVQPFPHAGGKWKVSTAGGAALARRRQGTLLPGARRDDDGGAGHGRGRGV